MNAETDDPFHRPHTIALGGGSVRVRYQQSNRDGDLLSIKLKVQNLTSHRLYAGDFRPALVTDAEEYVHGRVTGIYHRGEAVKGVPPSATASLHVVSHSGAHDAQAITLNISGREVSIPLGRSLGGPGSS
ncbi:hypothetical protein [Streptomyces sp. NPDC059649]|uniref:hypothetical protein n=1 Tax=Streptomyces sp. NPDC059649 TaxID=3346895 RepID=UPI0036B8D2EE